MSQYPLVSIIFPNFNGGKEPLECLASIQKLNYPNSKIEVIVVDNNSTDGSDIIIRKKFPGVKLLKNKTNLGFAKAINQGIKKSQGQYILITNDDIVFEKKSLKIMVEYALNNLQIGALGGKIFLKSKPKKIISAGFMINKWTGKIYMAKNPSQLKKPDWVQGCCMMIPKKVINKVGLLDEDFTHLFEDMDYCLRVKYAGFQVVYLPDVHVWHGESLTADKNTREKYYQWYKNKFRFMFKNMSMINILSISFMQVFIITPYRLLVLRDGRFSPFLKGFIWNIKNLKQTLSARV